METLKGWALTAYTWLIRYPIAILLTILIVAGSVVILLTGAGDRFNIGGIIGKLFGTKTPDTTATVVNEIPEDRKTPMGEPDDKGWVQHDVGTLDTSSNPFRDKGKITIQTDDGPKKIALPVGIKDTDVEQVILIGPSEIEVVVKSGPKKVSKETIDYLRS